MSERQQDLFDFAALARRRDRAMRLGFAGGADFLHREVGGLLPRGEGAILAYARGLMHWHRRHRFCGRCGQPLGPPGSAEHEASA